MNYSIIKLLDGDSAFREIDVAETMTQAAEILAEYCEMSVKELCNFIYDDAFEIPKLGTFMIVPFDAEQPAETVGK